MTPSLSAKNPQFSNRASRGPRYHPPVIAPRETAFLGWQGLALSAGPLRAVVVPAVGGRVMGLSVDGVELFYQHPRWLGRTADLPPGESFHKAKHRLTFRLWGGDKTWVAPQDAWADAMPPVDLDSGVYDWHLDGHRVVMTSPLCRETGCRIRREVSLDEDGTLNVTEHLTNEGTAPAHRGLWNVTQLRRPMTVWLPMAAADLRPYPQEGDSVALFPQVVRPAPDGCRVLCHDPAHFKVGGTPARGELAASRVLDDGRTVTLHRSFDVDPAAAHAHGAAVEIYNAPALPYLEVEVHAPLTPLPPGATVRQRLSTRVKVHPVP